MRDNSAAFLRKQHGELSRVLKKSLERIEEKPESRAKNFLFLLLRVKIESEYLKYEVFFLNN